MNQTSFDGEVSQVSMMTEVGEITILPWHQSMTTMVVPSIIKITPSQVPESGFIIDQGIIAISIGKWLCQIIWEEITVLTSISITNSSEQKEVLESMKQKMEEQIAHIKTEWTLEELEQALIEMEKIWAELRIAKLKNID